MVPAAPGVPLSGARRRRAFGVSLELRQALEPWPVLGEGKLSGGTTRPVDSSLERVQVLVTGATGDRYVIACNGYPLPLAATGTLGEAAAAVRFRACSRRSACTPTSPPRAAHVRLWSTPGQDARSAAAGIMWRIRAAATSMVCRSMRWSGGGAPACPLREHRPHGGRGCRSARPGGQCRLPADARDRMAGHARVAQIG